jgi:hypothetical protein
MLRLIIKKTTLHPLWQNGQNSDSVPFYTLTLNCNPAQIGRVMPMIFDIDIKTVL